MHLFRASGCAWARFFCRWTLPSTTWKNGNELEGLIGRRADHPIAITDFFYVDQETTPVEDIDAARAFQRNLLAFLYGQDFPWPKYGAAREIMNITDTGFEEATLPADLHARCEMVNRVILDPGNGH